MGIRPRALHRERRDHARAGRGVRAGVREQVDDHLAEPRVVAGDAHGVVRQVAVPVMIRTRRARVADRVEEDAREVDRIRLQLAPLVEAREEEEVLDDRGHAHRLRLDARQRVRHVLGQLVGTPAGELGVSADGGERGAQLVARVRHVAPHLRLARLPRRQRRGDVPEQAVERGAHAADLGALVGVGCGHAGLERDVAAIQLERGHVRGRVDDPVERTQRAPHDDGAQHRGERQGEGGDDGDHDDELLDHVVGGLHRQAGDEGRAGGRGVTDEPIAAERAAEVDRAGDPVGGHALQLLALHLRQLHRARAARLALCRIAVGDVAARDHAVDDGRADRADLLPERAEPAGRGAGEAAGLIRVPVDEVRGARRGGLQLLVDLLHERRPQREDAHRADEDARERQQPHHAEHEAAPQGHAARGGGEPGPQRCGAQRRRARRRGGLRLGHSAALSM